ncbi:MAG: hypothetical protein K8F58_15430 [Bauldia sp.]|nr:hypothetical protein [Bauldia sp.]
MLGREIGRRESAVHPRRLPRIELVFSDDAFIALERALDPVQELAGLGRQEPDDFVLALRRGYPHSVREIYFLTDGKFVLLH